MKLMSHQQKQQTGITSADSCRGNDYFVKVTTWL